MKKSSFRLILLALTCLAIPLLAGCGQQGTNSTMSKDEEAHFKSGPMPPEAQKAMAEQMKKANEKNAAAGGVPGGPSGPATSNP